jgi:5'-deoxynucleotidase YfbR-like HD superfamily hydrolase
MPDIWTQTRTGKAFDLLAPDPDMVDFAEIAETLAYINRYNGAFEKPISVAQHTIIVFDAADPEDRAHALLHDAHEAFIGDISTPTAQALATMAGAIEGQRAESAVKAAIVTLKLQIDVAIYAAAGLPQPDARARRRIRTADLRALQTERRDFLARTPKPWAADVEAHAALPKTYRLRPASVVAEDLYKLFKTHLPALRRRAA